jgi:hypothetical protein
MEIQNEKDSEKGSEEIKSTDATAEQRRRREEELLILLALMD